MKNQEIAKIFNEIADLLEIKGDNPFRIRAYRRAALNIENLSKNIESLTKEEILEIPGIGQDLAEKINNYLKTGIVQTLEELKNQIPEELLTIMSVPGVGPKTAKTLYEKLNIKSIEELEKFASAHKLSSLPGIKRKTEENIIKGIEILKKGRKRHPIGKIMPLAVEIVNYLQKNSPLLKIDIAGSLRRWKDTIKDIDIVATSKEPQKVMQIFTEMPHVKEVLLSGPTKSSVILKEGIQIDLRLVDEDSYGAALAYFTGSKEHNIKLREMALKKGLRLNEYGIFKESNNEKLGGKDEKDIYDILGLPYIEPELREDRGEIELALKGSLPSLISLEDIKGDLHVHSKWSDGSHTFEELVEAARAKGYSYIAVTDHSKGLGVANGLTEDRLLEQSREIKALNKKLSGFKLLHGVEVDIKSDGSLDLDEGVLKTLDIVIASIHSGFKQSSTQITSRLLSAIKNPYVQIIAHPTGRLLGEREPYDMDIDEIMKAAQLNGTAFEINAYPARLDLNDIFAKKAKEMSIPLVISTDTHIIPNMDYMRYGISIARRAWLEKDDVLNTLSSDKLIVKIKKKIINQSI
ncbi:MAG: DNA polymerase/3'-5' exonuclease PolX [Thermodesulfovibrionales bacterium]|nr:DNA polymerase/3'-5' exonuclease PolX [Thermodesulfovibrionales bacterium]